jgi:hypothetical protein
VRSREHYEARKADRQAAEQQKRRMAEQQAHEAAATKTRFWRHADRLVRYTGWLQAYTLALSLGTVALFVATGISAFILHSTDSAIRAQLEEMKAARRPWVTITPQIAGDLIFDSTGLRLKMTFDLHNTGPAPALSAIVGMHTFQGMFIGYFPQMESECNIGSETSELFGIDVFPNEHKPMERDATITSEAIEYWNRHHPPEKPTNGGETDKFRYSVSPTVGGCVVYKSASDEKTHRTPFAFNIMRLRNGKHDWMIYLDEGRIPASDLYLAPPGYLLGFTQIRGCGRCAIL